jgi:hypothetical protein
MQQSTSERSSLINDCNGRGRQPSAFGQGIREGRSAWKGGKTFHVEHCGKAQVHASQVLDGEAWGWQQRDYDVEETPTFVVIQHLPK